MNLRNLVAFSLLSLAAGCAGASEDAAGSDDALMLGAGAGISPVAEGLYKNASGDFLRASFGVANAYGDIATQQIQWAHGEGSADVQTVWGLVVQNAKAERTLTIKVDQRKGPTLHVIEGVADVTSTAKAVDYTRTDYGTEFNGSSSTHGHTTDDFTITLANADKNAADVTIRGPGGSSTVRMYWDPISFPLSLFAIGCDDVHYVPGKSIDVQHASAEVAGCKPFLALQKQAADGVVPVSPRAE